MQRTFGDEYKGKRWTYGLQCRPLGFANVPDGWIIHSERKHPKFIFGTVDYPFELPPEQAEHFQLKLVNSNGEYDIFLNENEECGRAACGCEIGYKDNCAYLKMCQIHHAAEEMIDALKYISNYPANGNSDPEVMSDALENIIGKVDGILRGIKSNRTYTSMADLHSLFETVKFKLP